MPGPDRVDLSIEEVVIHSWREKAECVPARSRTGKCISMLCAQPTNTQLNKESRFVYMDIFVQADWNHSE